MMPDLHHDGSHQMHGPHPALTSGGLAAYRAGVSPLELRELFWQNMMREILVSLAITARSGGRLSPSAEGAATGAGPVDDLFDGRLAVVTALGKRIPIGDIYPVFACSVGGSQTERMLSADVQCSIFQIRTPGGEIHTIPVSEVRSFHSLTEDLVKKLEQQSQREREEATKSNGDEKKGSGEAEKKGDGKPFGFAAFTQLARSLETPMPAEELEAPAGEEVPEESPAEPGDEPATSPSTPTPPPTPAPSPTPPSPPVPAPSPERP